SHRALSEHKTLSISWSHYRRSSLLIPKKSAALFNRQNEKGIEIFSDITPPHPSDYSDMSAHKGMRVFGDQPRLCLIIVRLQKSTTVN
ncbi:hypothetical protein, partial [Serratia marcescens]